MHLQPDDRAVLYSLSRALRNNGQTEEAKAVEGKLLGILRSSDKLRENSLEATRLNNEGVELEKSGNLSAALEKYTAALELDPLHGGYRRNLALGLCRLGQWDQGIAELREVLRQNPDDEVTTKALYIAMEQATASKAGKVRSEHD
jgi:tetratricopeptide (TPR) repeat protein